MLRKLFVLLFPVALFGVSFEDFEPSNHCHHWPCIVKREFKKDGVSKLSAYRITIQGGKVTKESDKPVRNAAMKAKINRPWLNK